MGSKIDNENNDLEHYGTWVKKDLQNRNVTDQPDSNIDDLEISDLDFDNDESDISLDDDFLSGIDSLDLEDSSDEDDFDLGEIHDIEDDLISPEEEDELISMAEDDWQPGEDQLLDDSWDDDFVPEDTLSDEDLDAAGDFLPEDNSDVIIESDISDSTVLGTSDTKNSTTLSLAERQTLLLEKIESELSDIKAEILDIRSRFMENSAAPAPASIHNKVENETKGFFEEDDDESIVLTGDELDNIINTAEMTAEDGEMISLDDEMISEEDPGLSILTEPDVQNEISLDHNESYPDEEELSLGEEELNLDEEELNLDEEELNLDEEELNLGEEELSLDEEEFSLDEEELSLDEEELSLGEEEFNLDEEELNLDEEELSLGEEELSLGEEELSLGEEELSLGEEELSLGEEDLSLDEISLDDEQLPDLDLNVSLEDEEAELTMSLDSEDDLMGIDDISLDLEDVNLDDEELGDESSELDDLKIEDVDDLVIDLTSDDDREEGAESTVVTEDVDLNDFGFENTEVEDEIFDDVLLDEVEDVSLDDLLEDSEIVESPTTEEDSVESAFDFDMDITEVEEEQFDEGEVVSIDNVQDLSEDLMDDLSNDITADEEPALEDLSDEEIAIEEDQSELDNEPLPEGFTAQSVSLDLPRVDENEVDAVHLDNSDLPELDNLNDLSLEDNELPNITESETEIILDISDTNDDFDLDATIIEEVEKDEDLTDDGFELPGTEEIDLNSLEALAITEENDSESEITEEELADIAEEPIEIDLDDISEDITETVSDIIDDQKGEASEEEDDVIAIDLPVDDNFDEESLLDDVTAVDTKELDEEDETLELTEEPEEFTFSQDVSSEDKTEDEHEQPVAVDDIQKVVEHPFPSHSEAAAEIRDKIPRESSLDKLPPDLRSEIREILTYMDQLLESLPEEKIQEFARSEHFEVYKKIFEELGISN